MGFASNGDLARAGTGYANADFGFYNEDLFLPYAGLLIYDGATLYDNAPSDYSIPERATSFKTRQHIKSRKHPIAQKWLWSSFETTDEAYQMEQHVYTHDSADFLILNYLIGHTDSESKSISLGLFSDIDLANYAQNVVYWDETSKVLMFRSFDETQWAGIQLLDATGDAYSLGMANLNGNTDNVSTVWTSTDKINLITGSPISSNGNLGTGNDVAGLLAARLENLHGGQIQSLAYVLALASSQEQLIQTMTEAEAYYRLIQYEPPLAESVSACPGSFEVQNLAIYETANSSTPISTIDLFQDTTLLVRPVIDGLPSSMQQLHVRIDKVNIDFSTQPDTLELINGTAVWSVSLPVIDGVTYSWSMDERTDTGHSISFELSQPGTYVVELTASTQGGCETAFQRTIEVIAPPLSTNQRPNMELFPNPAPEELSIVSETTIDNIWATASDGSKVHLTWSLTSARTYRVQLNNLKSGLYLIHIISRGQTHTRKIIVR